MRFAILATLSGLTAVGSTAVVDLGDLAQYKSDVVRNMGTVIILQLTWQRDNHCNYKESL
jgi:hypothetical protein